MPFITLRKACPHAQTKLVGRPAPVYYAHRAAYLGPYYDKNFKDALGMWDSSSSSSGGSSAFTSSVIQGVRKHLYYA